MPPVDIDRVKLLEDRLVAVWLLNERATDNSDLSAKIDAACDRWESDLGEAFARYRARRVVDIESACGYGEGCVDGWSEETCP